MSTKVTMGVMVCVSCDLWVADDEDNTIERVQISPFASVSPSDVMKNMDDATWEHFDDCVNEARARQTK